MNTMDKLKAYREYLVKYKLYHQEQINNPLGKYYEEKIPRHFNINDLPSIRAAALIRREIMDAK